MGAADRRSVEAGVPVCDADGECGRGGGAVLRAAICVGMGWWWCCAARETMAAMGWSRRGGWRRLGGGCGWCCWGRRGSEGRGGEGVLPGEAREGGRQPSRVEVREIEDEAGLRAALEGAALVMDAVVGTGFKPPLRGLAAVARELLAEMSVPVVAVDLPSGWDADSMEETAEGAFRADAVVTFTAPKLAHVFGHLTAATFGPVVVAEIGTPEEAIESATGLTWAGASKAIAEEPRAINGNKGRFGHVLMVGGAYGKAGAPSMASLAAMRRVRGW